MRPPLVVLLVTLVVTLAAGVLTTGVSPAEAKQACWRQVVEDWAADGRLDQAYAPKCLTEARDRIPDDLKQYSNFDDEIQRQRRQAGRTLAFTRGGAQTDDGIEPRDGLFRQAFTKTNPRNADSIPLPLLILGGLALLLVAGGGAGLVTRRLRARAQA